MMDSNAPSDMNSDNNNIEQLLQVEVNANLDTYVPELDFFNIQQGDGNQFEILDDKKQHVKKYNTSARMLSVKFREIREGENFMQYLNDIFSNLLERLGIDFLPTDTVGMSISNSSRVNQRSIGLSLRPANQMTAKAILSTIEKIVQSNEQFFIDGCVQVKLIHVKMPVGKGKKMIDNISSFHDFCKKKRGIIVIENNDNLCLARSLVVAIAHCHKNESDERKKYYNSMRRQTRRSNLIKAKELCRDAGVDLKNGGGLEEIKRFQDYLKDYCITVFDDRRGTSVLFEGTNVTKDKHQLDLIYGENHFNVIASLSAAFSTSYYCRYCHKCYENHYEHRCKLECICCKRNAECSELNGYNKTCQDCNRSFKNPTCFNNHSERDHTNADRVICTTVKCCKTCKKIYHTKSNNGKHVCYETFCSVCNCYKPAGHLCFIKPYSKNSKVRNANFMYLFFDFECTQEIPLSDSSYEHRPNVCVAQNVCDVCLEDEDINNSCIKCGVRQHVFRGKNTLEDFMDYVRIPRTQFSKLVLIAHNMKSYDGVFLLKYMVEKFKWVPEVIMTGSKIQMITYDRMKVIDSLNYFNSKLSALPKMFSLNCDNKGFFPHYFNKEENWFYKGDMPEAKEYGCDEMSSEERKKFFEWYENKITDKYIFDLQNEIQQYCKQDVTILRLACLKFRELFMTENDIDPFIESVTIASAAMTTFRKRFMEKETIGVIPSGGYRMADVQSKSALSWLQWEELKSGQPIQHAGNGREVRVCGYKVDGFHESATGEKTVYEYNGCWFHGCRTCFTDRKAKLKNSPDETMDMRYERTMRKRAAILSQGYKLVEMWDCTFNTLKHQSKDLREFLNNLSFQKDIEPLKARDALFGGRTNCTQLYYEVEPGEKIQYLDVCSLYPWACKYGRFPKVLVGDACPQDLKDFEGLVKATVLPPENLYHPVLPVRAHNKLFFPLCRKCLEELVDADCTHSSEERCITGTWVAEEVKKAESAGYKIIKVHEVWQYNMSQYERSKGGGLFAQYVDNFLKLKQEASGWPDWCKSNEDREKYIKNFEEKEGILLDKDKVEKNPGFRALSKMLLNAFWGKFAQRNNMSQTSFLNSKEEYTKMLTNPNIEVADLTPLNEDIMLASWKYVEETITPLPMTNVVIATHVTCIARLKLYSYLEELNDRVLYFDTDSIIFVEKPGMTSPAIGDFLGDLTDEISCYGEGSFIDTFVSGGPKNYAFRVRLADGTFKFVCKVKGINLNFKNSKIINFESLKSMVLGINKNNIVLTNKQIRRTKDMTVVTCPEKKTYRVLYTKRRRVDDYNTVPYGFKRQKLV